MKKNIVKYDDQLKFRAVVYLCEMGLKQSEIAVKLELHPSALSRLLKDAARKELYSEGRPYLREEAFEPEDLAQARRDCVLDWNKLQAELKPPAKILPKGPIVHVVSTGPLDDKVDEVEKIRGLSRNAADHVASLLERFGSEYVGISWGRTVYHLCETVRLSDVSRRWREARQGRPINFIPVSGDLLGNPDVRLTSSNLCHILHKAINGSDEGALSLGTAAAYIPAEFGDEEAATIRRFFNCFANYRAIFGSESSKPPLIDKLDGIIMSVGSSSSDIYDPWLDDAAKLGGITRNKLDQITLGNIAGFFMPKTDLKNKDHEIVKYINTRWTGINRERIAACALRGAREQCAGVIVLASGQKKAAAVRACSKSGLANHIFIDMELADALIATTF